MIRELSIEDFRGFDQFKVDGLAPITVIGGMNNSGKSSFLEALLLSMDFSSASVVRDINLGRGLPVEKLSDYDSIFNQFATSRESRITCTFDSEVRELLVRDVKPELVQQAAETGAPVSSDGDLSAYLRTTEHLSFRMISRADPSSAALYDETVYAYCQGVAAVDFTKPKVPLASKGVYVGPSVRARSQDDLVELYLENNFDLINQTLHAIDPRILEVSPADGRMVALVNSVSRRMPLNALGDGTVKCAYCLAQMLKASAGGTCAFDEIENGLHYSAMKAFSKALVDGAATQGVQLFITTHSLEMLHALAQACEEMEPSCFLYLKMGCRKNGKIVCDRYDYRAFRAHLENDFELR